MTRIHRLLAGLIAVELAVGGYFASSRLRRHVPPLIDSRYLEPITADDFRGLSNNCRTAGQWAKLGEAYLASGFFPEAEACYREAVALDPNDANLAYRYGFAVERLGMAEEANVVYERAVELGNSHPSDCWYNIGRNDLRLGRQGPAREAFERATDLPASRFEIAKLDFRDGRTAEAEAMARHLADEYPSAIPPLALLYRIARVRGEDKVAEGYADQFFLRKKRLPTPFESDAEGVMEVVQQIGQNRVLQNGFRLNQERRPAEAEKALRVALAADWQPQIADQLALSVFMLGRPAETVDILADAVTRAGPEPFILWRLGQAYLNNGQAPKARDAWQRSARLMTGHAGQGLWLDMSNLAEKEGDQVRAKTYRARSLLSAGLEQYDKGRFDAADKLLKEAVGLDPRLDWGWYYLGETASAMHQPAAAAEAYKKCLSVNPDHGRAIRALKLLDH